MFLPQDYTTFQIKKKKILRVRLSESPDFNAWKLQTLSNYRKKQHNFLRDFSFGDIGKETNKTQSQKLPSGCSNNSVQSSFQIYKNKQKLSKQKLQHSQIKNYKLKSDQFYCTLKLRENRSRKKQNKPDIIESQIGKINTQRIEIRSRSEAMKTSDKKSRQSHKSQCSPRKSMTCRQFSVDLSDNSPQLPQKNFIIRKGNQKNTNFDLSRPCRPWSPFHNIEQSTYPCEQNIILS